MGMYKEMKKKAIPASSSKRSDKVIKIISKGDIAELNRTLEPIIEQNKIERLECMKAFLQNNHIYSENLIEKDNSDNKVLKK